MTPEEIKKEQEASKIEKVQPKDAQVDKLQVNASLEESNKSIVTPPKESKRQYSKKVGDYKKIAEEASLQGIDLDNADQIPLTDEDRNKIDQIIVKSVPKELVGEFNAIANSHTAPKSEERAKLDAKALMASARKQRRAKFGDALYAFGEGLQGKTANPEAMATTRLQRQRDEQFKDFKEVTERNQKTKFLWETQHRNELIDWAEKKARDMKIDEQTRMKYQQMADKFKQEMAFKEKQLGQQKEIADARNKVAREKIWADQQKDKNKKKVTVQTAKSTYELNPEEAEYYKGEVLKNSEVYRGKYPGLFEKVQETDEWTGKPIEGKFTYKLNPRIKDVDLIRVYLEENKEGGGQKITPENQSGYFDKYRKEKGLPTSDVPVSQTIKQGATQRPQSQSQKVKSDPLGLGL